MPITNISHFDRSHVQEFMGENRFLHVYGALREKIDDQWATLDVTIPQNYNQVFHDYRLILDKVYDASKGIRTIDGDDKLANETKLIQARQLIAEANVVYLLGFGFDSANIERLQLTRLASNGPPSRSVYFTNFRGLDSVSMAAGRALANPSVFLSPNPHTREYSRHHNGAVHQYRYQMSTKNVYDAIAEDFEAMGGAT